VYLGRNLKAMKYIVLFGFILFIASCTILDSSPEQKKAEISVKKYIDSISTPIKCKIINFNDFHPTYFTYEDDPQYDKYKNNKFKADSIKKNFKPTIRAWVIYVTYNGKDSYGNIGKHKYICALTKDLNKCVAGIQIDNIKR
jgi:hypothetical protein